MTLISQTVVITKVADPLVSIQPFISSSDLGNSGVVHPMVTNSLSEETFGFFIYKSLNYPPSSLSKLNSYPLLGGLSVTLTMTSEGGVGNTVY